MGTNYYAIDRCECCGREDRIHIGKSSAGWGFALHVIPEMDLFSIGDWSAFLVDKIIEADNGSEHTLSEMLEIITSRSNQGSPEYLQYPPIDDTVIGKGKGTYYYRRGEFS